MNGRRLALRMLAAALLMAFGFTAVLSSRAWESRAEYAYMLDAAKRTQAAFAAVKTERQRRGLSIQKADDLNETGLIGDYLTPVTTTLGNLEAKRTSVNPNAAFQLFQFSSPYFTS